MQGRGLLVPVSADSAPCEIEPASRYGRRVPAAAGCRSLVPLRVPDAQRKLDPVVARTVVGKLGFPDALLRRWTEPCAGVLPARPGVVEVVRHVVARAARTPQRPPQGRRSRWGVLACRCGRLSGLRVRSPASRGGASILHFR